MNKRTLERKTYGRLRTLAARAGIRGSSRMGKKSLVNALSKRRTPRSGASNPVRPKSMKSRASAPRAARRRARAREMTELPSGYGQTRLVLMEVDPHLVHAYWEVTPADRKVAMKRLGTQSAPAPWILRFYEVAEQDSGGAVIQSRFDVPVDLAPGNWYVSLPASGRSYRAELGPISGSGRFHAACRSNAVTSPRAEVSSRFQPRWLEVGDDFKSVRRVPQPAAEPLAPALAPAGPAAWPLDEPEITAHAEVAHDKGAAGSEPGAAPAQTALPSDGPVRERQARPVSPHGGISSFALGGPRPKSAGSAPAPEAAPRRSD
jgi:hypothetical protein